MILLAPRLADPLAEYPPGTEIPEGILAGVEDVLASHDAFGHYQFPRDGSTATVMAWPGSWASVPNGPVEVWFKPTDRIDGNKPDSVRLCAIKKQPRNLLKDEDDVLAYAALFTTAEHVTIIRSDLSETYLHRPIEWRHLVREHYQRQRTNEPTAPVVPSNAEPVKARKIPLSPLRSFCRHLGERIEFLAGCQSGFNCKWKCASAKPEVVAHLSGVMEVVPGRDDCQECPGWEGRPEPILAPAKATTITTPLPNAGRAVELPPISVAPTRTVTIDNDRLARGRTDFRFNASIIRYQGRLLMTYRVDRFGSEIYVCDLHGSDYDPGLSVRLELDHPAGMLAREDPRFFIFRGRLHIAFVGVDGQQGPTTIYYARLSDDFRVEQVYRPCYSQRAKWEKNWGFFEYDNELYAVYTISPHVVYRIDGNTAYPAFGVPNDLKWETGGELRGGASPVRIGDEFWHVFHGMRVIGGVRMYSVGAYKFAASPPFRPLAITPTPMVLGNLTTRPEGWKNATIFPAGAILDGDRWLVSYGEHDAWITIAEFNRTAMEAAMVQQPASGHQL